MLRTFFDRVLDAVVLASTRYRWATMLVFGLLAAATAWLAPQVTLDPSPKGLVSSFGDQRAAIRLLERHFGSSDHVVFVIVRAPDVMQDAVLTFVAEVSQAVAADASVERVDSVTAGHFAFRAEGTGAPESLDDLEQLELGLEAEQPGGTSLLTGTSLEAVEALVQADLNHFRGSLSVFSDRTSALRTLTPRDRVDAAEAREIRQLVEAVPALTGTLVGRPHAGGKRRVIAIVATLRKEARAHEEMTSAVRSIDRRLGKLKPPDGVRITVAGLPHFWVEMVQRMETDQRFLVPITLLVCLALLWASYRWWPAVVLPGIAVLLAAGLFVAGMVLLGEPLNVLNNVIPALLIFIGIADSIHLVNRYREELAEEFVPRLAVGQTIRAMAVACLLTSLTTAVGLGALSVSKTTMLRGFGIGAALGVMLAYLVTIFFLPSALSFFRPTALRTHWGLSSRLERGIRWLIPRLLKRPFLVLAVVAGISGLAAATVFGVEADTKLRDQFGEADPIYRSITLMDGELAGVRPLEVMLVGQDSLLEVDLINRLQEIRNWAESEDGVLAATDPGQPFRELHYLLTGDDAVRDQPLESQAVLSALWRFSKLPSKPAGEHGSELISVETIKGRGLNLGVSEDEKVLRLQLRVSDLGAQATMKLIAGVRERVQAMLDQSGRSDLRLYFTGDAYTGSVPVDAVATDMLSSLALAVVLILLLLTAVFRSWRLSLLASLVNLLPLLFAVAWMVFRGIPLTIGTAVTFSISFGLAVDGTIHMVSRLSEERGRGEKLSEALVAAASGTGNAVAVSSLALMLGFLLLTTSNFVPIRHFGELVAVTTGVCFLATVLVLPVLLSVGLEPRARRR